MKTTYDQHFSKQCQPKTQIWLPRHRHLENTICLHKSTIQRGLENKRLQRTAPYKVNHPTFRKYFKCFQEIFEVRPVGSTRHTVHQVHIQITYGKKVIDIKYIGMVQCHARNTMLANCSLVHLDIDRLTNQQPSHPNGSSSANQHHLASHRSNQCQTVWSYLKIRVIWNIREHH